MPLAPQGNGFLKTRPAGHQFHKPRIFLIITREQRPVFFKNTQRFIGKLAKFSKGGVASMYPPQGQGLIHMVKLPVVRDSIKNVGLFAHIEALVKPAPVDALAGRNFFCRKAGQRLAADHGRRHGYPLPLHQRSKCHTPLGRGFGKQALENALAVKNFRVGAHQTHAGVGFKQGHLPLKLGGPPQVVAIEKCQIPPPRLRQCQIAPLT